MEVEKLSLRQLYDQAKRIYPNVLGRYRPLAIGIHEQLDPSYRKILGRHTNTTKYLKAIKDSRYRYNLDGTVSAEISVLERLTAIQELDRREENYNNKTSMIASRLIDRENIVAESLQNKCLFD